MRIVTSILALGVLLVALGFAGITGLYAYYARELPDPGQLSSRQVFQTARLLDRNGAVLEELVDPSGGRRTLVRLADIPPVLRDATIAAEDASFYANPGFDPRAVVRAVYQYARYGSPQSGASTITQQLVKNALLGPEQTAERKIKEAFLAIELTRRYSKDEILEMYLNEIYYGNRAYGIEAASETYFGKSARELNLAEASLLAGLPQAPAYYDPYTNMAEARARQQYVLEQMVRTGRATEPQAQAAFAAPPALRPRQAGSEAPAPHFTTYVRQKIEEQFGTEALFREGLQVTTTLDLKAQQAAERAARGQIGQQAGKNVTNAALVAIQPASGEILAMLGSVDFNNASIDGQVNVTLADRQPGSTLKPFTYITSFAKGWNPATMILDAPKTFGGTYRPNNFDDKFRGPVTVREALGQSLNIPAVETLQFVGIPDMLATAHRMGIQGLRQPDRYGLSVTLGGGEVRLLDLTYAYAALANGGRQVGAPVPPERAEPGFRKFEPVSVLKVTTGGGRVLYQYTPPPGAEVADPRLVYQITSILSDDDARVPTYGPNSALVLKGRPSAAKTGTTDNFVDAWTVGYTPDLVTGVWVGNTNNTPMQNVGGGAGAGPIWNAFMTETLRDVPPKPFAVPSGVVEAEVCKFSGLLATQDCRELEGTIRDVFAQGINLPTKADDTHKRVEVCRVNGKIATPLVPANGREIRVFVEMPEQLREWGAANGFPPPPTETCADVYQGNRKAEITSPPATTRIVAGQKIEIGGSAYIDDFAEYTLDVGPGANPGAWNILTDRRTQAVDNGLLAVWDTTNLAPGTYTLRVRVSDSLGNAQEGRAAYAVAAPATPTPTAAPTAVPKPSAAPTRPPAAPPAATPTRQAASTAQPARPTAVPKPGR